MTDQQTESIPVGAQPNLERARSIAAIVAMVTATGGIIVLIVLLLLLYPSARRTVQNLEIASAAAATASVDMARVSAGAAQDLTDASHNLNQAVLNFRAASENYLNNSRDDSIAETIIRAIREERLGNTK